jgi:hypothetical protein
MNNPQLQIAGSAQSIPLSDLLSTINSLSTSDCVALLKHLLNKHSISTVLGSPFSDFVLWQQVNQMSRQQLGDLLKVIAFRIPQD